MRKPKKQKKPLNDLNRSLTPFDPNETLIGVVELSKGSWLVSGIIPGVERQPLKKLAPDENELLKLLERWRAEAEKAGHKIARVARRLRDRPGRLLVGPVAEEARYRGPCHPCRERGGIARAPSRQDRPARHRTAQALLPRLAARRAGPLQDGSDPDLCRGGCQASPPRARDPRWRAHHAPAPP